ncbi:cytochrome c1 [Paracoccus alkenifer]|uniref:Cytochrome c1 n=1 Tax=Paracoccus alkenifer TaxID=65735 RepID=A0A1H6M3X5_9RHOB|nr:cytochrome c1 [Paracoccus alkenifer]SEH95950.1 ubiquinol-cytochrome c reductase cytochrome c1 subunit [Paracoccus alkenifer]
MSLRNVTLTAVAALSLGMAAHAQSTTTVTVPLNQPGTQVPAPTGPGTTVTRLPDGSSTVETTGAGATPQAADDSSATAPAAQAAAPAEAAAETSAQPAEEPAAAPAAEVEAPAPETTAAEEPPAEQPAADEAVADEAPAEADAAEEPAVAEEEAAAEEVVEEEPAAEEAAEETPAEEDATAEEATEDEAAEDEAAEDEATEDAAAEDAATEDEAAEEAAEEELVEDDAAADEETAVEEEPAAEDDPQADDAAEATEAAEIEQVIRDVSFSFEGPFGKYDQLQLQRGLQVYTEVCAGCHGMKLVPLRTLSDPNGPQLPEDQMRAYAAEMSIFDPELDDERPREPTDMFPSVDGEGMGPDLSLMAKARAGFHGPYGTGINQFFKGIGGPEYIYSILTGYTGEETEQAGTTFYENTAFPGGWISMAPPLSDDQVEFEDGSPTDLDSMAQDMAAFLMWTAEPKMMERKQSGLVSVLFLIVLTVLLYLTNKRLWWPIKHRENGDGR